MTGQQPRLRRHRRGTGKLNGREKIMRSARQAPCAGPAFDRFANEAPDRLLNVEEAAQMLGLKSPRTLYKWSYEGRVRSVKVSRNVVRFYHSDLERILAEGERPAFAPHAPFGS